MPTGGRIRAPFCSPRDHRPQNSGCVYTVQSFHTGWTRRAQGRTSSPLKLVEGSAEAIPIDDRTIDTVVTTWTMGSIPAIERALHEMRRVLKTGGRLLFVEHGRAPEPGVRWWQDHLTPVWKRFSGGCHLNRPIPELIQHAGYRIGYLDTGYMRPGPKPMTFMYEGSASPQ